MIIQGSFANIQGSSADIKGSLVPCTQVRRSAASGAFATRRLPACVAVCVAVFVAVLQCVAVCCSVLQWVAVCGAVCCNALHQEHLRLVIHLCVLQCVLQGW